MIWGIDLSLNHAGIVELGSQGELAWWTFVTDKKTQAGEFGFHFDIKKTSDKQQFNMDRLSWWEHLIVNLLKSRKPTHVGIEDYAPRAMSNSTYQIGELGGIVRRAVLRQGAALRLHDPMTVKMYVVHSGNATPEETQEAVLSRWPDTKQAWAKLSPSVQLDLAPAYGAARLVLDELDIRAGRLQVSALHEKEIRVWNRVTKANPVNILARDWIIER